MEMQTTDQAPEKEAEEDQVKVCLVDLHLEIHVEYLENSEGFLIHCSWTGPDEEAKGQSLSTTPSYSYSHSVQY